MYFIVFYLIILSLFQCSSDTISPEIIQPEQIYYLTGNVVQYSIEGISPLPNAFVTIVFENSSQDTLTDFSGNFNFKVKEIPEQFRLKIIKQNFICIDTIIFKSFLTVVDENGYSFENSFQLAKYVTYFPLDTNKIWYYDSHYQTQDFEGSSEDVYGKERWKITHISNDSSQVLINIKFSGVRILHYSFIGGSTTSDTVDNISFDILMDNDGEKLIYNSCSTNSSFNIAGYKVLEKYGIPFLQPYSSDIIRFYRTEESNLYEWIIKYGFGYTFAQCKVYYPYSDLSFSIKSESR